LLELKFFFLYKKLLEFFYKSKIKCGPCPPDFEGDGYSCRRVSPCAHGRNPCHQNATCFAEPELRCECPAGMAGDGVGLGTVFYQIKNTVLY
jgi:hypothetical protein